MWSSHVGFLISSFHFMVLAVVHPHWPLHCFLNTPGMPASLPRVWHLLFYQETPFPQIISLPQIFNVSVEISYLRSLPSLPTGTLWPLCYCISSLILKNHVGVYLLIFHFGFVFSKLEYKLHWSWNSHSTPQ